MEKRHIEVVGAGPAGLTAAIYLARMGCAATIYEEKEYVGQRFYGDFQGLENWTSDENVLETLERIGIDTKKYPDLICQPYNKITIYDPNLEERIVQSVKPIFYLIQRGNAIGSFDRLLLKIAQDAGVKIIFKHRKERLEKGGIIATGPSRVNVLARGMIFKTDMEDMVTNIVDDNVAPKGYAYLIIHKGTGTLATVLYRDFKKARECFEKTVEGFNKVISLAIKDKKEFGGFGNFFFDRPVYENGIYYVGEAAGLQDCLWGFGMRYAVVSGYLAARSIIEGKDYASIIAKELLPTQKASLINRFFYERVGNRGYSYLINRFARGNVTERLKRYYTLSPRKRLLYPIVRLAG